MQNRHNSVLCLFYCCCLTYFVRKCCHNIPTIFPFIWLNNENLAKSAAPFSILLPKYCLQRPRLETGLLLSPQCLPIHSYGFKSLLTFISNNSIVIAIKRKKEGIKDQKGSAKVEYLAVERVHNNTLDSSKSKAKSHCCFVLKIHTYPTEAHKPHTTFTIHSVFFFKSLHLINLCSRYYHLTKQSYCDTVFVSVHWIPDEKVNILTTAGRLPFNVVTWHWVRLWMQPIKIELRLNGKWNVLN